MAVYYIYPGQQFNGDGLSPTPATSNGGSGAFNTPPTFTANNTYKIKRGTRYVNSSGVRPQGVVSAVNTPLTLTTYFNNDGSDDSSQPKPIIDLAGGSNGLGCVFIDTCTNVVVENIVGTNGLASANAAITIRRSNNVYVNQCEGYGNIYGCRILQDQASGTSITTNITINNGSWYNNDGSGIYFNWGSVSTAIIKGLTITNNLVYNNGYGSPANRRGGIMAEDDRASGAGNADSDSVNYSIYDLVIDNNVVFNNRSYGINAYAIRNEKRVSSISYNIVYNNGLGGDLDTHSIWAGCSYGTVIQGNYVHNNFGYIGGAFGTGVGIFIDYNSASSVGGSGSIVRGNTISLQWAGYTTSSTPSAGIHVLSNTNVLVESNFIKDCKTGISITGSPATTCNNCTIQHNTIYNALGQDIGPVAYSGYGVLVDAGNNVIVKNNAINGARIGIYFYSSLTGFVEQYNSLYGISSNYIVSGTSYSNATPSVLSGTDIITNPLMSDNGTISVASPLYRTGQFLGYGMDNSGNSRNNPPSIGAFEYVSSRIARQT